MCEAELKRIKLRCEVEDDKKYTVNTSYITKKKFFQYIKGYHRYPKPTAWPSPHQKWCPRANMYYAFNEDTNPFTRVTELAETLCICSEKDRVHPHFGPPLEAFTVRDPYPEDAARLKQLTTKPACFVIFGKPDLNSKKLAKMIADSWNCVLISPEVLLKSEIDNKTDKGRWIKQVLRLGRSIGPEVIMNLVESRVNKKDVLHRGYVVEGLPLIPNDPDLDYSCYPLQSEVYLPVEEIKDGTSSVSPAATVGRKKDDEAGGETSLTTEDKARKEEAEGEGQEELPGEGAISPARSESYDLALNPFATESLRMILRDSYEWDIEKQIEEIFNVWPLRPDIIVYVMCPDQDAVHRRGQFRLDPHSGNVVDTGLLEMDKELFMLFSRTSVEPDTDVPTELYQEISTEQKLVDEDFKKHLLKRLCDMRTNVEIQCKIYERYALPCIERQVLMHNPQDVIRVDGRTTATRMFQIVRVRLRTLPLPRVILPKKLSEPVEVVPGGEEPPEPPVEENLEGRSNEDVFQELAYKGAIAPRFRWRMSHWKFLCPVALVKGHRVEGNPRYAIRYTNKMFFLSTAEAMEAFIENPRPFLSPSPPRQICKIVVCGPPYSGKSQISQKLATLYGGGLVDVKAMEIRVKGERLRVRIRAATNEILQDVIYECRETLTTEREEREEMRIASLKKWRDEAFTLVNQLARILRGSILKQDAADQPTVNDDDENKSLISQEIEAMRGDLDKYNLASLVNDEELRDLVLLDKKVPNELAPEDLLQEEAPIGDLSKKDPAVAAILDDRLKGVREAPVELTNDDLAETLIGDIKKMEGIENPFGFDEGGWIVDGMYTNPEIWAKVTEAGIVIEEIVWIHEEDPYDYLLDKWRKDFGYATEKRESVQTADAGETGEESLGEEEMEEEGDDKNYAKEMKRFDEEWEKLQEKILELGKRVIDCLIKPEDDIIKKIAREIDDRYRLVATVMTDEEKEREAEEVNVVAAAEPDEEFGEEEEGEEEDEEKKRAAPKDNRRLGDSSFYCPVALYRHNVLWKGKEEMSALFMDKIYLLSSQKSLDDFILDPREFVPQVKPLNSVPPLRICIVGPQGSGKTTLAKTFGREFGLAHIDFQKRLDLYMKDRLLKSVGPFEDVFNDKGGPPGNLPEEPELPEDLEDERYNTDEATIQKFIRRYLTEGAVLPKRILEECLLQFFKVPYRSVGIAFDGFPSCSYDLEAMRDTFSIPEMIVELRCSNETVQERVVPGRFDAWKAKQDAKKEEEEDRYNDAMLEVLIKRAGWVNRRMKERRRQRRVDRSAAERAEEEEAEEDEGDAVDEEKIVKIDPPPPTVEEPSTDQDEKESDFPPAEDSDIGEPDEELENADRMELEESSLDKFEEPTKFEDWEDPDAARERISQEIDQLYESATQNLVTARGIGEEELIPWVELDAEKDEASVFLALVKLLDSYIFRNASFLERTCEVEPETAERLLDTGHYFLSSFGRYCPVQMYEDQIPFQMFLPMEARQQIYPVLHRQYAYFIAGKERLAAFLQHPLKYLEQDSCVPLIPAHISIIGPPKCGKSTLAERFAKAYGMKVITRGQALRHTIRNYSWTELALLTDAHFQSGHVALEESIARAVELHLMDPRSASQGYVLDGFPVSQSEAEELAFLAIQPMVIIDLKASIDFSLECLAYDADGIRKPSTFSPCYLSRQYEEWAVDAEQFRSWLKKFTQNVVELDGGMQKWAVWTRANEEVCFRFMKIKKYFREADYDKVNSLTYMCVSPYEFRERQSEFESFCPGCLRYEQSLTFGGAPPDREGVVQFRDHYYWICSKHMDIFCKDPLECVSPTNKVVLPETRPRVLEETIDIDHACWARRLKSDGFCLVSFLEALPRRKLVPGKRNLGVLLGEELFLFCSIECRDKFVRRSYEYSKANVHFRQTLPPIRVKQLPNLGFLEQTVAALIVRAVNRIGILRPKLPGMTPEATAAIYIGVYLKTSHKDSDLDEVSVYEEAWRRMNARQQILQVAARNAKKMINPHVSFPIRDRYERRVKESNFVPPPPSRHSDATGSSVKFRRTSPTQKLALDDGSLMSSFCQSTTRRVPVPDARFDYLCDYFKPASKVPAFLNVVDIAGLVKGAAEGQGLGNSFLSHINACDAIFHLCRAFEDDDVTHVEGEVNPVRDLEIISEELRIKDVEFLNTDLDKLEKLVVRGNDKKLKPEYETLLKVKGIVVDEKKHIRFADWSVNEIDVLNKHLFLTSKPVIYLVNLSEKDYIRKKNKWLIKIKEWVDKNDPGAILIPFSGVFENKVFDMDDAERTKYYEEHKATSALDKIIIQGYKSLQLQYFFTSGHDEVKAWTIQKGTKAPQAAGRIHTDFEKGFIMAEVMKFDDFKSEGSESACKAAGKYRQQGRNYVVDDGDIIFFKFNAGAGLKDAKKK